MRLAVSVISGAELERRQIQNIAQVAQGVPNVTFQTGARTGTGASTPSIFLRGVGPSETSLGTELYVADAYIAAASGASACLEGRALAVAGSLGPRSAPSRATSGRYCAFITKKFLGMCWARWTAAPRSEARRNGPRATETNALLESRFASN